MSTMRKEYKPLTKAQIAAVKALKESGDGLSDLMDGLAEVVKADGRCMALAKTNLEQAIMWATKGMT